MSIKSGFYDAERDSHGEPDRVYNSAEMSDIFEGVIENGVFPNVRNRFKVTPGSGAILVDSGRAWLHNKWILNDGPISIPIEAAHPTQNRYDAVIIEANNMGNVRAANIFVVKGTPSSSPEKPKANNTTDISQFVLAYIYRPANSGKLVTTENIDYRVGTKDCPFVKSVVGPTIRMGYAPPDNSVGIDGDVYIQLV